MTKTRIAIIYDFDKTLSKTDMQEPFIERLGVKKDAFWNEVTEYAKKNNMDNILAYLYCMIDKCKKNGIPFNRKVLNDIGKEVEFFNGLDEWFSSLKELEKECNVKIEHFIISSGLKEIIEGTVYYNKFNQVFACEYHYDENGNPVWMKNVINYTTKTQILFRINKGEFNIWDDQGVNKYVSHDERPYPFENMIYIGDGNTDIPCLKLVKQYGGNSIGLYDRNKNTVMQMMYDDRINYYFKADYSIDKDLYRTVEKIIRMISYSDPLKKINLKQFKDSEKKCGELFLE